MPDDDRHLAQLLQQEEALQFSRFSNADALAIGLRLVETARARGQAIRVEIHRNGLPLFVHGMDDTHADNADWVRRKNNVVQRFGHSSFYVGTRHRAKGTTFEAASGLDLHDYAAHGGAFPLTIRGVGPVGTITVSGLPQAEDHALVVEVLSGWLAEAG